MGEAQQIETLRTRHAELERRLDAETARPRPDQDELKRIKRAKLRIKDELAALRPS